MELRRTNTSRSTDGQDPAPGSAGAPHALGTWRIRRRPALVMVLLLGLGCPQLIPLLPGPKVAEAYAPFDLANFQNEYACNNLTTRIVRPRTLSDVEAAVQSHSHVMAAGGGWSWNQPFWCASNGTTAPSPNGWNETTIAAFAKNTSSSANTPPTNSGPANIVMSTLRPLIIDVNETEQSVFVDAGVRTIDLLRYLANYVTPTAPSGWTLPAFPWFVFQTLGGAVSTGTHGSSQQHHSLSSQVLELTVVLANGTTRTFSNATDPFLMRALRVSVGKLGIITHIKFRIMREVPVTRTLRRLSASQYLDQLRSAQAQWAANSTLPAWFDETEWFWVPQRHEFLMVSYTRGDSLDAAERLRVLKAYAGQAAATTAYNTSLQALQAVVKREGAEGVTIDDWPLLTNVTFDPTTNISTTALPVLRRLNESVINAPWQQASEVGNSSGSSANTTTTTASGITSGGTITTSGANKSSNATAAAAPMVTASEGKSDGGNSSRAETLKQFSAVVTGGGSSRESSIISSGGDGGGDGTGDSWLIGRLRSSRGSRSNGGSSNSNNPSSSSSSSSSNGSSMNNKSNSSSTGSGGGGGGGGAVGAGDTWSLPEPQDPTVFYGLSNMADAYIDISRAGVYSIARNATAEALDSYLYQPEGILEINIRRVAFDQYEAAVPVASMADCWEGLLALLYGSDNIDGDNPQYNGTASPLSLPMKLNVTAPGKEPDYGFRSNPLIRSTGREDALLSNTHDQPHLWLNIEDYLYYNRLTRRSNAVFKALVGYLRSDPRCGTTGLTGAGARMHWGKAGWPDAGCWHGDKEFPDTWCDFGCAARQLDPYGKFSDSAPDRWTWEGVDLAGCCTAQGFNASRPDCTCTVRHARSAEDCPPAPYYTYR